MGYLPDTVLRIGEAAKFLNVPITTLRRWTEQGRIYSVKSTKGGHRYYTYGDLVEFRNQPNSKPRTYLSHIDKDGPRAST